MGFLELFNRGKKFTDKELLQEGVCPNCWGRQEYERKYQEFVEDKTKSAISGDPTAQKAFIQQFVEDHLTGIRLKRDGDYQICPACKKRHKVVLP